MFEDRTVATGFESAFINTYEGWDQLDTAAFIFMGCEIKEDSGLPFDGNYDVAIDLERLFLEVYNGANEVIATKKIALVITDN